MSDMEEAKDERPEVVKVRQQILTAFGSLQIPDPATIIRQTRGKRDRPGEERIRAELGGKSWQELDADFLKRRWSAFCYLSDTGYQYYLPALLMRALEPYAESNGLLGSVIFSLPPSPWKIYEFGRDKLFDHQTSLFTREQHGAVCGFLELGLMDLGIARYQVHECAQALRWGWNRWETPAAECCRQFYRRMADYNWPEPAKPEAKALGAHIREGFAAVPHPGDNALCEHCQDARDDEGAECALALRGMDWRTVHPELLAVNDSSLSFLSAAGLRFFLPGYLIASLTEDETGVWTNAEPLFHLTYGFCNGKDENSDVEREPSADDFARSSARFAGYTAPERAAIVAYLRHRQREDESQLGFYVEEIQQALDRFWLKQG